MQNTKKQKRKKYKITKKYLGTSYLQKGIDPLVEEGHLWPNTAKKLAPFPLRKRGSKLFFHFP